MFWGYKMTWLTRLIIGLIISSAGYYFYQKNIIDTIMTNIEESDSYESDYDSDDDKDSNDENDDYFAYDEYETDDEQ